MSRWKYPFIGLFMNVLLGTIYSWSVFRRPLEEMCGWTDLESCLPFSVFIFFFAATMPLGGYLINRVGPRKTALLGAVLVGGGWVASSLAVNLPNSLLMTLIFYGVVAGSGVGLVYGVPISVSSKWIPDRKGVAIGITVLGFGLSPLITAPLATYMILNYGVSQTMATLGIAYALLLTILSLPMKLPPPGWRPSVAEQIKVKIHSEMTAKQMLWTRLFYSLWVSYFLGTMGGFIAISMSAKYGVEVVGMSPEMAAFSTGIFAVFNGGGRVLFGYLTDNIGIRTAAMMSFTALFVASLLALASSSAPFFLLSFSLFWLVFGGWLAMAPNATSTFFGLKNLGLNYGIVFTAYGASALIGPPLAEYLEDVTDSTQALFLTITVISITGAILASRLKPERIAVEKITG
ncbi:MAG: OFA family MFS transporter [Candidatus Caldarchaeum sp.]|jgi:MFS family permease